MLGAFFGGLAGLFCKFKGHAVRSASGTQARTGTGSRPRPAEEWDIETELPSRCDDEVDDERGNSARPARRVAKARSKRPTPKKRKGAQDQVRLLDAFTAGLSLEDGASNTPKGSAVEDTVGGFCDASAPSQASELRDQEAPARATQSER
eukprot:7390237-Prymnesium_polylepis.1